LAGCAVVFGVSVLIEHPQAQPGYVPPPTPLPHAETIRNLIVRIGE
jgi:hypothetical protein